MSVSVTRGVADVDALATDSSGNFTGLTKDDGSTVKVPYILAQSAVPVIQVPNGTVATNGIVTLVTAMPATYSGGAWIRLPADAVVGGAAGLYWCVFSSATAGQVYTNFSDPATQFIPTVPTGALVAAVGSNVAYTQTTAADVTLLNVTVPANALGSFGVLRFSGFPEWNNSAGTKTPKLTFGGTNLIAPTRTTTTNDEWFFSIRNTSATSQIHSNASGPTTGVTVSRRTINTTVNAAFVFSGQLAVATDFIVLEAFCIEVRPS